MRLVKGCISRKIQQEFPALRNVSATGDKDSGQQDISVQPAGMSPMT